MRYDWFEWWRKILLLSTCLYLEWNHTTATTTTITKTGKKRKQSAQTKIQSQQNEMK